MDRATLAPAQTPQGVRRGTPARGARRPPAAATGPWTDEAALLEACRIPVHVVPGDPTNLKVTVPADLARAADLLAGARPCTPDRASVTTATRSGRASPLRLGGLEFEGVPRLVGHCDGDVALHAVADALLGAAGLGDLGRLFPAGPATPRRHRQRASCSARSSSGWPTPAGDRSAST